MASIEMLMPKMGESIMEATVLTWLKSEGDSIEQDESVLEVATDKVDTEVPASESGILKKILVKEGDVVEIGKPIAIIEMEGEVNGTGGMAQSQTEVTPSPSPKTKEKAKGKEEAVTTPEEEKTTAGQKTSDRFYSPLVRNIAKEEGISQAELEQIPGTGKEGRVTKKDILNYLQDRSARGISPLGEMEGDALAHTAQIPIGAQDEIIQMDRMRRMIATRMVESRRISAHVTSFVEADVTELVLWRNRVKDAYKRKEGESFTFTPIFMEAVATALKEFPMINISVKGEKIIKKKDINIGMAVALTTGNLIVPVVKNADQLSLTGLSKKVNDLASRARDNQLKADDLADGTYTISNIGAFGNIMGTPIIVQPQVAILALGTIVKKPAVLETPQGDAIAIRHKMYLSHSYDHRVVDGALGGKFVKRVANLLENFDTTRTL